jgi:hypothetical protein
MAKPNYSFEKRQRELAKKKKKEEKVKEKAARKPGEEHPEGGLEDEETAGIGTMEPGSTQPAA